MPDIEQPEIWSVSHLTRKVKALLEQEISFIWIEGEISNWRCSPAGHAYFTLKDDNSQVSAVIFRGRLQQQQFVPVDGMEVIVYGEVTVYEKRGNYQVICSEILPKGQGALQLAFEELKKRLEKEGLFDPALKKPIPLFPKKIGVVTSPCGAAFRDILNVLNRRFSNVHVILAPTSVQGDEAAEEIVDAIARLEEFGVDVMIVGRGGGSLEDLWPFNEEIVVRAIHEAKTPIISAVGHEIDFTLSDFAADLRAPTPSAAAELVVQEREAVLCQISQQFRRRLCQAMGHKLESCRNRLDRLRKSYVFQRPEELIRQRQQQLDDLHQRLDTGMQEKARMLRERLRHAARGLALLSPAHRLRDNRRHFETLSHRLVQTGKACIEASRNRLRALERQLEALSPLAVLSRGYSLATLEPEDTVVRSAEQLAPGSLLRLRFERGTARARVEEIDGAPERAPKPTEEEYR